MPQHPAAASACSVRACRASVPHNVRRGGAHARGALGKGGSRTAAEQLHGCGRAGAGLWACGRHGGCSLQGPPRVHPGSSQVQPGSSQVQPGSSQVHPRGACNRFAAMRAPITARQRSTRMTSKYRSRSPPACGRGGCPRVGAGQCGDAAVPRAGVFQVRRWSWNTAAARRPPAQRQPSWRASVASTGMQSQVESVLRGDYSGARGHHERQSRRGAGAGGALREVCR